eukprot:116822_1
MQMKLIQCLLVPGLLLQMIISQDIFKGNIACGDAVNNYFNQTNDAHIYNFILNQSYAVTFHTCGSELDTKLFILANTSIISTPYCSNGDDCGYCSNSSSPYNENITIPIQYESDMVYHIQIFSYSSKSIGKYQINIECHNHQFPALLYCGSNIRNESISLYTVNHKFILDKTATVFFDLKPLNIYSYLYNTPHGIEKHGL